jgi:hypothetical protein
MRLKCEVAHIYTYEPYTRKLSSIGECNVYMELDSSFELDLESSWIWTIVHEN